MFKVGQKVVCVDASARPGYMLYNIKEGHIYTILGIIECSCGSLSFYLGFKTVTGRIFCSVCNHIHHSEMAFFNSRRFRPLNETFATEVLESIKEQIEQEQLVLI